MRHAELLGEHHAHLRKALVVGLQAREDEVDFFRSQTCGQRRRCREGIRGGQVLAVHMNGAVGAARERFAQDLRHARGAGRNHDHFPAVLLAQPQGFFQGVSVWLVELPARFTIANPGPRVVDADLHLACHYLFDADNNDHEDFRADPQGRGYS